MKVFDEFLVKIEETEQRKRVEEVLAWVLKEFPELQPKIAWNQPMFTDHGTFIIGFSISKKHLAVGPELSAVKHFDAEIEKSGYKHTKMLIQIPWESPVDYTLLKRIIEYNILDKAECMTFWRK